MEITRSTTSPTGRHAIIHCDGSCPANPGPMGIGFRILVGADSDNGTGYEAKFGYRLGPGTNNRAEYLALIASMREALRTGITHATIYSDSLLIVNQVGGKWACKDHSLKPLLAEAQGLVALFTDLELEHIPREENSDADYLSKNPTDPTLPPPVLEIDITTKVRRKLSRQQAAMIRWWWKSKRCQNEYRLARIFGGTESHLGKIGRGELYKDITEADLPGPHMGGALVSYVPNLAGVA